MISRLSDYVFTWFEKRVSSFPSALPERPPSTFLGFVLHYSVTFRWLLIVAAIIGVLEALGEVLLFAVLGQLVDWLAEADRETFWDNYSNQLIWAGVVLVLILPLLRLVYETIVHQGMLGNFAMRTRWQAHRYVLRQNLSFFHDDYAGRIATKVMQTSLAVRDLVFRLIEVFLFVSVYFVATLVLFALSDLRLTAPLIVWLVGYVLLLRYFIPRLAQISAEQADHRSVVTGRVVDSYSNISTVKMFADASREDAYIRDGMEKFLDNVYRQMRLSNILINSLYILGKSVMAVTAGLAIWLWTIDAVTIGAIAFAMGLLYRIQGFAEWVMSEIWSIFENVGVIRDGMEMISREQEVLDVANAKPLMVSKGLIQYRGIQFNYGKLRREENPAVIDGLNLTINAGEKVGIVGRSGAGKSTLVNLLLRFHDLEAGQILIDDQDIAMVQQESLRAQVGVVTQDTALLHRSVLDNIRYGRPDAGMESILAAVEQAEAYEFISGLADRDGNTGFAAQVGERGVKLSGGQRQRIAIARVLLKDAPILVLDEATSALDSEVEAAIQDSLYQLMKGKTVLAIAHRLSTIAAMDRLIVMDAGKIVEVGDHQSLIAEGGVYARLWERQSGGFLLPQEVDQPT